MTLVKMPKIVELALREFTQKVGSPRVDSSRRIGQSSGEWLANDLQATDLQVSSLQVTGDCLDFKF